MTAGVPISTVAAAPTAVIRPVFNMGVRRNLPHALADIFLMIITLPPAFGLCVVMRMAGRDPRGEARHGRGVSACELLVG
ncbi:hypothetical protein GCM10009577_47040 [Streptomyces javensis]